MTIIKQIVFSVVFGVTVCVFAPRLSGYVLAAASVSRATKRQSREAVLFRNRSAGQALRRKEWTLLWRDPWLVSQTLMQLLYLLPPAFLLWRTFGQGSGASILIVPVLIMAAGQMAGALAWLAICGEDERGLVDSKQDGDRAHRRKSWRETGHAPCMWGYRTLQCRGDETVSREGRHHRR